MSTPAFRGVDGGLETQASQRSGGRNGNADLGFSVPEMVATQAAVQPKALAVSHNGERLLYGELEARANQLAWHLQARSVAYNSVIGVYLKRTLDMVVATLGIMKARAAYMPLDPSYPDERLAFMVADAGCPVVVTTGCGADKFGAHCVVLDRDAEAIGKHPRQRFSIGFAPDQLAYVIYTSGSTGTPKGVAIHHAALANLVQWHTRQFQVGPSDRASHVAGLGFDAAVWELWPYLAAGASVHLADDDVRTDPEALRDWMVANSISIGFVPTPLAERMISLPWPAQSSLRIMLTGGDTLHTYPPSTLSFSLVNNYGPTECAVVATSGVVPRGDHAGLPSIGSAIDNVEIYILDEQLRHVPDGTPGELYIGGASVGMSYLNHPKLTEQSFLPDPFNENGRMYRTGDLGRRLADGQIAFLGRADDQIKIRGYRVEPDEIAFLLNSCSGVRASAVVAHQYPDGDTRLVAYLVANSENGLTSNALQEHLRQRLPDYMIPAAFVLLDSLPLTANGKLDRAALPAPTLENTLSNQPSEGPRNVVEERVAGMVAALLQLESVGRDENFFMLGGHSLLGTQLIARLRNAFDVEVPLRTLFEKPTVVELSQEIESLILAKIEPTKAA